MNMSILPSRDLRNSYSHVSELCRSNPVAITVNGREDTVLTDHAWFMEQQRYISELESKLAMYAHLAQAADDIKLGRVREEQELFGSLFADIEAADEL